MSTSKEPINENKSEKPPPETFVSDLRKTVTESTWLPAGTTATAATMYTGLKLFRKTQNVVHVGRVVIKDAIYVGLAAIAGSFIYIGYKLKASSKK